MEPKERLENLTKSIEETKKHIQSIRRLGDYKLIEVWETWLSAQEFARDKLIQEIAEEKEMNSKVVTAEDISRIFTEMEEKYGKDKAIGILVGKTQESVRLIDGKSAAQILFEKLQKYQNKEEEMKKLTVEYQGYKLEVDNGSYSNRAYFKGTCDELNSFVRSGYYENCLPIIEEFMKYADHVIENKKKKELNQPLGIDRNYKEKDEDVHLVEALMSTLRNLHLEMESLKTHPDKYLILDVKLGKIFELYKEHFHFITFDGFRTFYNMKMCKN